MESPEQARELINNYIINFNKIEQELCHIEKRITLNCFKKYFYQALDLTDKKNFPEIYQNTKLAKNFAIIKKIQDACLDDVEIADLNEVALKSDQDFSILNSPNILKILNVFKDMSLSKLNEYFLKLSRKFNDIGKEFCLKGELAQFTNIFPKFTKNILNARVANSSDENTESVLYSFLQHLCSKNSKLSGNLIFAYFNKLDSTMITNLVEIYYYNRIFYDARHSSAKQTFNLGLFKTLPDEIKSHIAHFVIKNLLQSFVDSYTKNQKVNYLYLRDHDDSVNMSDLNNFKYFCNSIEPIESDLSCTIKNTCSAPTSIYHDLPSHNGISTLGDILWNS